MGLCSQTDRPGCKWAGLLLCEMGMTCPSLLRVGAECREASGSLSGEGRPAPLGLVLGGCGWGRHGRGRPDLGGLESFRDQKSQGLGWQPRPPPGIRSLQLSPRGGSLGRRDLAQGHTPAGPQVCEHQGAGQGAQPHRTPPAGPASGRPPWLIRQLPVPPQGSPHGANKQLGFTKAPGLGAEAADPNLGTGQSLPQFPQQHTSTPQPGPWGPSAVCLLPLPVASRADQVGHLGDRWRGGQAAILVLRPFCL